MVKKIFIGLSKTLGILFLAVFLLMCIFILYINFFVSIDLPKDIQEEASIPPRSSMGSTGYRIGNNFLKRNPFGLWEMYLEGDAYQRGLVHGVLAKELVIKQEDDFVAQLDKLIPSKNYQRFLKYFIIWFNRDIDEYITEEYKKEIYGVSLSASDKYNFIGSNYERILNYHAAHDIGHALQDKKLVPGCTAFASWGLRSKDSTLLLGRNFDFYVGEGFAEEKIVCFVKPDSGYKFMYVTWGGMIGVVSGMNEKGLTITLNASKSDMPSASATPISILAREILQYASTSKEAMAIAKKRKTFVSEAIMIGSAIENKSFIIEKSPTKLGLYETGQNELLCSNHFQGNQFNDVEDIREQSSVYRYQRLQELLAQKPALDYMDMASILRDRRGLGNKNIGMGNEKALNQLIAHHSIIFKPSQQLVWVSTNPYQLGAYIAYDLKKIFNDTSKKAGGVLYESNMLIPADTFLNSSEYTNFQTYKKLIPTYEEYGSASNTLKTPLNHEYFISLNPEFYYTYQLVADYCRKEKNYKKAAEYYRLALTKEIPRLHEEKYLQEALEECMSK